MRMIQYPPSQFIELELRRTGMELKRTNNHFMMVCPFHRDTDPSLGVSLGNDNAPPGIFNCFGCGEKGTWNKLAKRLGLRLWNNGENDSNDELFIVRNKKEIKKELNEDDLLLKSWTDEYHWKSYTSSFLSNFGARRLLDKRFKTNYLYLPLQYLDDIYGYCKVRLNKTDPGPKYWFSAGMTKTLYPIDFIMNNMITNCICLVEGMADVFRCLRYGIPTLALLGVEITSFMLEQLESLAIKNVILCLDGDTAGKEACLGSIKKKGLAQRLEKEGYNVKVLFPPNDEDPDSMPIQYIHALGKLCQRLGGPKYTGKRVLV